MGQAMSFGLTQYDVEELSQHCNSNFSQQEIEGLYKRFRQLDRGHKGYVSAEEFMNIPELSINPLAPRLGRLFESVNFKDFVALLSAFSAQASTEDKLQLLFRVYDVDGDGLICPEDLELVLRQLGGSALSEAELQQVVSQVFEEVGAPASGMDVEHFSKALQDVEFSGMCVDIPAG
jgi:serine/threonine-protein phosphatase 2B regulatory subunit